VAGKQTFADCLSVMGPVAQYAIRPMARPSSPSLQRWDGVYEREGLLRVVTIGSGEPDGQGNSSSVANHMTFAAELRSVRGVGGGARCGTSRPSQRNGAYASVAANQSLSSSGLYNWPQIREVLNTGTCAANAKPPP